MNKTIIINISGVIFHIEEDAYETLKNYMNDIKHHFASYRDNFEIVTDIENRIAEMFSELLLKENKQVIVQSDVATVIAKMGNAEDFREDAESEFSQSNDYAFSKRKLFRDVDDRIIGGICSGIGHYFEIEARWIRVAFFVLFIFYGFGLLPYILLWMVMPKAKSRTEKMEMKGERVNLHSFQRNVEEEINAVRTNIHKASEYARPGLGRLGSFIRDVINGLIGFLGGTGRIILKIMGFIILAFTGLGLIAAFIVFVVFLGYLSNSEVATIFPLNAIATNLRPAIYICSFLVMLIPLLSIMLLMISILFNSRRVTRPIGFSMLMIWIIALAVGVFCIAKNTTDFKEEASFSESITLKKNQNNVYYLQMGQERTIQENTYKENGTDKIITITGNNQEFDTPNRVNMDLSLTENDKLSLIKTFTARGKDFDAALKNARHIAYYYSQKDSLLTFDYRSGLPDGSLWRDQEVRLRLNVPIGSTIYLQNRLARHFLQNQMYDCLDYRDDDNSYIKVTATKEGFSCRKTQKSIDRQREYNKENQIEEEVNETVIF